MKDYECLKLKNQLCFPIYLCSKEIIKKYTPYLEEIDLTYTQYIVMLYLWEKNETNVKDIGNTLFLDSGTLTPLLKKLEQKELIKRTRSDKDERNLLITLTLKGKELKDKALTIPSKMGECINISREDAEVLVKIIYKILLNIEGERL